MALLSASQSAQQPPASTQQVAYSYAIHKDSSNGHFVVEVTSTSNVILECGIQYSGHSFLDTDRTGHRTLPVRAIGKSGTPVVGSVQFEGFLTFTAAVSCAAK
jgi:hypothetical protein